MAAECGHPVVLHEAARRLGGQVLLAQQLPDRAEFGGAATNLPREATGQGSGSSWGAWSTPGVVDDWIPTWSSSPPGPVPTCRRSRSWAPVPARRLGGDRRGDPGRGHVVVADWRSDWIGPGVARLLAARGLRVTLAVNAPTPGACSSSTSATRWSGHSVHEGIDVLPWVRPVGIFDDSVYLQHVLTGEPVVLDGTTGLVMACGHQPEAALLAELRTTGRPGRRRGRRPGAAHGGGGGARGPAGRRGRGGARRGGRRPGTSGKEGEGREDGESRDAGGEDLEPEAPTTGRRVDRPG